MPAVFLAYVEDLTLCFCVAIITWILVALAAKSGLRHGVVDRVVLSWSASDGGPDLSIIAVVLPIVIVAALLLPAMGSSV